MVLQEYYGGTMVCLKKHNNTLIHSAFLVCLCCTYKEVRSDSHIHIPWYIYQVTSRYLIEYHSITMVLFFVVFVENSSLMFQAQNLFLCDLNPFSTLKRGNVDGPQKWAVFAVWALLCLTLHEQRLCIAPQVLSDWEREVENVRERGRKEQQISCFACRSIARGSSWAKQTAD